MKNLSFLPIFLLFSSICVAQSVDEFNHKKLKGDIIEVRSQSYMNVQLDDNGEPILDDAPMHSSVISIQNGYPLKTVSYQNFMGRKNRNHSLEFDYQYEADLLKKVSIYSYYGDRKKLFKWYQIFYKNGKQSVENIFYDKDDLRATMHYTHETLEGGNSSVSIEMYKPKEDGIQGNYFFEYTPKGNMVTKILSVGPDTGLIFNATEIIGDSIIKSISERTTRNRDKEKFNIVMETKTRYDEHGNPTFMLATMSGVNPETNEEEIFSSLSLMENIYANEETDNTLSLNALAGTYLNETHNLKLVITDDLSIALTNINPVDATEEQVVAEDEWVYALKRVSEFSYNEESGIMQFETILKDGVEVINNPFALVLSPLNLKLKEMYFRRE